MYTKAKSSKHVGPSIKREEDAPFAPRVAKSVIAKNHSESENNPTPNAKVSLNIPRDYRTPPMTMNRGKIAKISDGGCRNKTIDRLATRPRAVLSSPENDCLYRRQNLTMFEFRHHFARPKGFFRWERHGRSNGHEMNSHTDGSRLKISERKLKTSEPPRLKLLVKSATPTTTTTTTV